MYIVTGGAGFIGSCVVRTLNDAGINDIVIVDNIASTDKWMNMRNKQYLKYVNKDEFLAQLPSYRGVEAIIHMGACSSTTERDFDYLWKNNFEYTKALWHYCAKKQISFIYASSAATYGGGEQAGRSAKVLLSLWINLYFTTDPANAQHLSASSSLLCLFLIGQSDFPFFSCIPDENSA